MTLRFRAVAALCLVVGACSCDPEESESTLTIVTPTNGATLNVADDVLPDVEGLQVEVVVEASRLDGRTVRLEGTAGTSPEARVVGTTARLQLTVTGAGSLQAVAVDEAGVEVRSNAIGLALDGATRACRVVSPANGAVLGTADDRSPSAGFQYAVQVRCAGVELGNPATLSVNGSPWAQAPLGAGGLALFPSVELVEGENEVNVATVADDGETISDTARVTVDTGRCRVVMSPATGTVFNARGEEGAVADLLAGAPMDALVTVETGCPEGEIELRRGSVPVARAPVGAQVEVPVQLADGAAELRAFVLVGGQERGVSPSVRYTVDAVVPTASLSFPTAGQSFNDASDRSAEPGLQISVRGQFTGIPASSPFEIVLTTDAGVAQIFDGVVGTSGAFDVLVTLPDGAHELFVRARRPSGTSTESAKSTFSSRYFDARFIIAQPADGESLPLARDADPATAGFQASFMLAGDNLAGREGTLNCSGEVASFTLDAEGSAVVPLTFNVTACAGRSVRCTARLVADGVTFETPAVQLVVDPTPPVVNLLAPQDGDTLGSALLNVAATTGCPGEAQMVTVLNGAELVFGPEIVVDNALLAGPLTLPAGESLLSLSVSDAGGNVTEIPFRVFVDADVPQLAFIAPAPAEPVLLGTADDLDGDLANGFQYLVTVEVPNELVGTLVELTVGNRAPLSTRTATDGQGRRVASFDATSLPEGTFELRACATDEAGGVGCATVQVVVDTGRPVCDVSLPADGRSLGLRDDKDLATAGVQTEVSVTTAAENGTFVTLRIEDPQGFGSTTSAGVADGVARFSGISFSAEGTYVLAATCRTQAGVEGRSLSNRVGVDFTAPSVEIVEPADGAVLNAQAPDRGAAEGFQIDVKVRSDEAAFGAIAFLTVQCGQGPVTPPPAQVNSLQEATFRAVTLPSLGVCTLTVELEDAAGNRSEPVTSTVTVDRVAPVITIEQPADGSVFGSRHDALPGTPGFDLQSLRALVSGASSAGAVTLSVGDDVIGDGSLSPAGQAVRAEWSLVPLSEGLNEVVVEATDDAGNVGTGRAAVTVNTLAPVVFITNVTQGATLRSRNDVDPATPGLQFPVQLGGERLATGTTVRLCSPQAPAASAACEAGNGRVLASNVLSGGSAIVSGATIPEGKIELYAVAIDLAENVAKSPVLSLYVDSFAPVIERLTVEKHDGTVLVSPGSTGVVLGPDADSLPATPGLQVLLRVKISDGLVAPAGAVFFMDSHPVPDTRLGAPVFVDANGEAVLKVTLSDGGHRLHVIAVDNPGNSSPSPDTPGASPLVLHVGVDLTAPVVNILAPLPGTLLAAHDADFSTAGLQYDIEIDSDAGAGRSVSLVLDGAPFASVTLPLSGTRASTRVVLPEGSHTLAAQVTDAAGNLGMTSPMSLKVDSIAPVVSVVQPTDGQTLSTDADPVTAGFQIQVQVSYSQVENGRTLQLFSSTGGLLATATTTAGGQAVFPPLTVPGGLQQLTARVSDVSGNVTTSAAVSVNVDTNAPSVSFVSAQNPLWFGASTGGVDGKCHVTIAGTTDAAGATVALLENGNVKATTTASGNSVTFANVVVDPGQVVELQLRATDAQDRVGYSSTRKARCDLAAPSLTLIEPGAPTVKYVAYGNPGGVAGAIADLLPTPVLEADFTVAVADAQDAVIELSSNVDGVLVTRTLAGDGQVVFQSVRVASSGAHTLTVKLTDPAGNVSQATWQATVDVVAPGAANPQVEVADLRNGKVRLVFPAPGSDGVAGAPVAGYVVRRAAGAIVDTTGWAAATPVVPTGLAVAAPGQTQVLDVENLVPGQVHYFVVRAFDAAGNLGPLGTSPAATLRMNRMTVEVWPVAAKPSTLVASQFVVADLDGDGFDDMLTGNWGKDGNAGEVEIIYGGLTLSSPVVLQPAGTQRFGAAIAVGDVNGDGFTDLLVGAQFENTGLTLDTDGRPVTTSRDGAVHVYLGAANSRLASGAVANTVLQGQIPAGSLPLTPTFGFGFAVAVVDDLTGDGIDDVVVGAPGLFGNAGRVFVIAGRQTWPSTLAAVPNAHAVLSTTVAATGGPWFGHQLASLGDVDGDGRGDFAVGLPGGGLTAVEGKIPLRPVYLVSGALAAGEAVVETIAHAVYPEAAGTAYPTGNQFGARLVVGELTGDGEPDLAVLDGLLNQYFIYDGAALSVPAAAGGAPADLTSARLIKSLIPVDRGTGTSGLSLWKDVNGDGIDELSAGFTGGAMAAWCFYGRPAPAWRAVTGTLGASILIVGNSSTEGADFGVRSGSGHILSTEGRRDIAVFALSGRVTVLSDP